MGRSPLDIEPGEGPIYRRIKASIARRIRDGTWPAHYKLAAEEDLAQELGVARGTMRLALRELEVEGLVYRVHGRGTFVAPRPMEHEIGEKLRTFPEALRDQGVDFETKVLEQAVMPVPAHVAAVLGVADDAQVFYLRRLRFVGGAPIMLAHNYTRYDRCPGIESSDFTQVMLYDTIEQRFGCRLERGTRSFAAREATAEQARLLRVPPRTALLYVEQVVYDKSGACIDFGEILWLGDRIRFSTIMRR